jgi:hypothetical protein
LDTWASGKQMSWPHHLWCARPPPFCNCSVVLWLQQQCQQQ